MQWNNKYLFIFQKLKQNHILNYDIKKDENQALSANFVATYKNKADLCSNRFSEMQATTHFNTDT